MKQVLFAAATVVCCMLYSCQNASNSNMANSQGEKNKMSTHDIYQGIETGDTSKLTSIADDAIDHMGPHGTEINGGDNIKKMLADMHNHVKDLKLESTVMGTDSTGDYVFSLCRFTGTTVDSSMGMPAGGKMDSKSVDVIRFKDGKAVEHWGFMDPQEMMKMMPPMPHHGMEGKMMDSTHKK